MNVLLVNQGGGLNNGILAATSLTNYQALTWAAASAGAYPIDHYKIYRNGSLYATVTAQTVFAGYISGSSPPVNANSQPSGGVLTVTSVTNGIVLPGVRYAATGIVGGTQINSFYGYNGYNGTGGTGTYGVNNQQTLGSAGSPVTFSIWQYIDSNASGSNDPTWSTPATVYAYTVSAVDTQGTEGPQANPIAYGYQCGISNWNNGTFSTIENYYDTSGSPQCGNYDVAINAGQWLPTANDMQYPEWDGEVGAFKYFIADINPGSATGYSIEMGLLTRLPPGDVSVWHTVANVFAYGPAPVANTWATYKVPLSALGIGTSTFTGSISGSTLTVSAVLTNPAVGVDNGGFIYGPGIPSGTYIINYGQPGSIGTFQIAGPGVNSGLSVSSEAMTYQRTSVYKFGELPSAGVRFYMNNVGFSAN